jgi:hypothetical protein
MWRRMEMIKTDININLDPTKVLLFQRSNRLLAKLILQEGKALRVRWHSAEENPVLT